MRAAISIPVPFRHPACGARCIGSSDFSCTETRCTHAHRSGGVEAIESNQHQLASLFATPPVSMDSSASATGTNCCCCAFSGWQIGFAATGTAYYESMIYRLQSFPITQARIVKSAPEICVWVYVCVCFGGDESKIHLLLAGRSCWCGVPVPNTLKVAMYAIL